MSIALMTAVWRMDLPATDKMVLLALADAANDDGVTWIAVASRRPGSRLDLKAKCSLSERAIQGAIKRLCDARLLSRLEKPGKGVIYTVTPAADAPRTTCTPADDDVDPRSRCGETVSNPTPSSEAKASSEAPTPKSHSKAKAFDQFWAAYPRKVGKAAAAKAFDKAKRRAALDVMLAGIDRATRSRDWREGFVPNPATWLNQDRWLDEPDGPIRSTSPPVEATPEVQRQRLLHLKETNEWRESWGPRPTEIAA